MASRAPSYPQIARAQWLLGLDAPESAEEIRRAWKERVARTHPDRNAERASAATRVTAAFNQARELCEWWLEAGEPWPKPMPPEALRNAEPERVVRPPARTPEQNRSSFRPGDLVARRCPAAILQPGRSSRCARRAPARRIAWSLRMAPSPPRPSLRRWPTAVPCAASAAALRSSAPRCGRVRPAWPISCSSSARSAPSSRRCAASARVPARVARRRPNSATRASRSSRESAFAGPSRSGGAARGAQGEDARRIRARLRAVGRRLHCARRAGARNDAIARERMRSSG